MLTVIDQMAEKYGVSPTQVLTEFNTFDFRVHLHSTQYQHRLKTRNSGDVTAIANSYSTSEIQEVYTNWQSQKK